MLSPDATGTSHLAPEAEPTQAPDCSARSPGCLESLSSTPPSEPQPCSQDIFSETHPLARSQMPGKLPVVWLDPRPGAPPGEEGSRGVAGYLEATSGFIPPSASVWLVLGPARLVSYTPSQKAKMSQRGVMAGTEEPRVSREPGKRVEGWWPLPTRSGIRRVTHSTLISVPLTYPPGLIGRPQHAQDSTVWILVCNLEVHYN